ncbi:MAG: hypothetical protein JWQ81_916 [Amycolatopsis sp.]|jgi:hypothetical protein|uniref:hypothetical protein n=1 Tax=Amycolatopsis sp. TaxID=37632 RepID=UPI00260ACE70|nr:hypothetical protein [Amycolatopsis sp.]MCU1680177.1 hypothetical protein [Amycolatopsis sp.]
MGDDGRDIARLRAELLTSVSEAAEQATAWHGERDTRIVAAHRAGHTYTGIAEHAGISDVAVRNIVARHRHPDSSEEHPADVG